MNLQNSVWDRLVTAARRSPEEGDTGAPYGFATRVAALAMAQEAPSWRTMYARFSWRAVGFAGLLALVTLVTTYASFSSPAEDDVLSDEGTVAVLLEVS